MKPLYEIVVHVDICSFCSLIVSSYGQMSGEIPCATPDTQSVRTTSGPLGPSEKVHSLPYVDPRQPGMKFT